jgi:hypothetical protein
VRESVSGSSVSCQPASLIGSTIAAAEGLEPFDGSAASDQHRFDATTQRAHDSDDPGL